MDPVVVVGSGASAVHFALSLLEKGREVVMVDVGKRRPDPIRPDLGFDELKRELSDPVEYFLGRNFESVLYPGNAEEYYGFPPNRAYTFEPVPAHRLRASGFAPLSSFAQGGLAEAWTGGSYPFNDQELADFPFSYDDIAPYYGLVSRRIGISGEPDDLARFMPLHENMGPPLDLDEHARLLLDTYRARRDKLNRGHRAWLGRARLAAIREDRDDRKGCGYLGRCLWTCPTDSLYTPSLTLRDCMKHDRFRYLGGLYATHFLHDGSRRVTRLVAESVDTRSIEEIPVGRLVLAAGTLSSSRIFMESIHRASGATVILPGLMDNRQILMPFLNLRMIRRPWEPKSYQYHQLAFGLEGATPKDYVHGLVTTLKSALIHPIVQNVPLDLTTALRIFRNVHAALGIVNVNFSDTRRAGNFLTLEPDDRETVPGRSGPGGQAGRKGGRTRLVVSYTPDGGETRRMKETCARMSRVLRALGCIVPPGMTHVRPMGASVHYAGTIPMSHSGGPLTLTSECRSNDFENLWIVDGTGFPFVPAKNLTFTLMANAARVAATAF